MNKGFYRELLGDIKGNKILVVGATLTSLDYLTLRENNKNVVSLNVKEPTNIHADAHNIPCEDEAFDVVICKDLLHHVKSPGKVIQEMCRVSNNRIIVFENNPLHPAIFLYSLINIHVENGVFKHSAKRLERLFTDNGLEVLTEMISTKKHCFNRLVYRKLEDLSHRLDKRHAIMIKISAKKYKLRYD